MKFPFRKSEQKKEPGRFSSFFLHASDEEKKKVFTEAARQANEEQREVFRRASLKPKEN